MKGFELEVRVVTWRGEVFWEETACEKAPELEELTVLHPQPLLSILSVFQSIPLYPTSGPLHLLFPLSSRLLTHLFHPSEFS